MNIYIEYLKEKLDKIFNQRGEKYIIANELNKNGFECGLYEVIWDKNSDEYKVSNGMYFILGKSYYPSQIVNFKKEEIRSLKINKIIEK